MYILLCISLMFKIIQIYLFATIYFKSVIYLVCFSVSQYWKDWQISQQTQNSLFHGKEKTTNPTGKLWNLCNQTTLGLCLEQQSNPRRRRHTSQSMTNRHQVDPNSSGCDLREDQTRGTREDRSNGKARWRPRALESGAMTNSGHYGLDRKQQNSIQQTQVSTDRT